MLVVTGNGHRVNSVRGDYVLYFDLDVDKWMTFAEKIH